MKSKCNACLTSAQGKGIRSGAEKRNSNDRESVGWKWFCSWCARRKDAIALISYLLQIKVYAMYCTEMTSDKFVRIRALGNGMCPRGTHAIH